MRPGNDCPWLVRRCCSVHPGFVMAVDGTRGKKTRCVKTESDFGAASSIRHTVAPFQATGNRTMPDTLVYNPSYSTNQVTFYQV
jgi:hypothetical protein